MMEPTRPRSGGGVILLTFLGALTLVLVPLPGELLQQARPEWVALILLYWSLALPERVGVGIGWLAGLAQDALLGTLLGQHALAFAVIAYLALRLHQPLRLVPVWQQALVVLGLLLLAQLVILWINGLIGRPLPGWPTLASAAVGAALWPLIFLAMRGLRRRFQVQ